MGSDARERAIEEQAYLEAEKEALERVPVATRAQVAEVQAEAKRNRATAEMPRDAISEDLMYRVLLQLSETEMWALYHAIEREFELRGVQR